MHKTLSILFIASTITATPAFAQTAATAKPKAALTCKTAAADGLTYTVLTPGKGEKPGADAKVKVDYKGMLASDGSEFDAGQGAEFKVGGVIPGFAQGLQLMQPGGKYRLCIPARLGYGEAGTGPIPPNADLVFEVDLLSFTTPPPKPVIPVAERNCDKTTASGLGYKLIKAGAGKSPTESDTALVDFSAFDAATGSTLDRREWEKIPVKEATAIFGEALKMMQVGASYTFCQPQNAPEASIQRVNMRIDLIDVRPTPTAD